MRGEKVEQEDMGLCRMKPPAVRRLVIRALVLPILAAAMCGEAPAEPSQETAAQESVRRSERFWRRIAEGEPYETLGARAVFRYGLALCEARQHPERLERLFALAIRMQDRAPESATFGNLKWTWRDPGVTDQNAVEFCCQDGLAVWLLHRDWLPERARAMLHDWLTCAVQGCLRHRVPASYTNIAVLNAANLVVLGETFSRPEVAEEGYQRLDSFCLWVWAFGIQEYCSPTYYGVDLDGLKFLQRFARRDSVRQQASALLDLFWTDIALNWFPAAERLGGPHSRSYDYLHGLGELNRHVSASPLESIPSPRLVRQSWGPELVQSRTHVVYPDVTLGCSGAAYGLQDMPLTVDLAGGPEQVRCYFIADGREDPYGKVRYETSSARHLKALHLQPFWAGAQRGPDALGLVVYRPRDLAAEVVTNVQSHFVLRRSIDGLWLRGRPVHLPSGSEDTPGRLPLDAGDPIVFRQGTAAVGVRLLWARSQDGAAAAAALVGDGNPYGALRLTVEHGSDCLTIEPGAALWLRVGGGLETEAKFEAWRKRFETARPDVVETSDQRLRFEVPGEEGRVAVSAESPYGLGGAVELHPEPSRAVLECDGREIGRPKLASIEPMRSFEFDPWKAIEAPVHGGMLWEAEQGLVFHAMATDVDGCASDGRFVWQPKDEAFRRTSGSVFWPVTVSKPGRYYLWARVLAPDPNTDSFYLSQIDAAGESQPAAWQLERDGNWTWQPFSLDRKRRPTSLNFSAGHVWLRLRTRESGTKIDQLFLTSEADARPPDLPND